MESAFLPLDVTLGARLTPPALLNHAPFFVSVFIGFACLNFEFVLNFVILVQVFFLSGFFLSTLSLMLYFDSVIDLVEESARLLSINLI